MLLSFPASLPQMGLLEAGTAGSLAVPSAHIWTRCQLSTSPARTVRCRGCALQHTCGTFSQWYTCTAADNGPQVWILSLMKTMGLLLSKANYIIFKLLLDYCEDKIGITKYAILNPS